MNIINSTIAPLKVVKDKTYEIVAKYILSYIFGDIGKNSSQDVKKEITRFYSRISTYKQLQSFFEPPTHIIDNIYLGNAYNAANYYELKNNNIKLIINVTKEISQYYPKNFIYFQYELYDNDYDNIKQYLDDTYKKIKQYQQTDNNGNILIHCFMGASRSASVVLYYLTKEKINPNTNQLYKLNEALSFLKKKRPIVNPTIKLLQDLNEKL